jgi:MOSC domain-containing protein YiiM
MERLESVRIIEDYGLEGDRQARKGRNGQVLVMPAEVLDDLGLSPGMVRENLTTRGVDVMGLRVGDQLRIGSALLEVAKEATPCHHMDEVRDGLQAELAGRRGMLARVLQGGEVRTGDPVEVQAQPAPVG